METDSEKCKFSLKHIQATYFAVQNKIGFQSNGSGKLIDTSLPIISSLFWIS